MGIISEFREFALKGNMIDLAVGVVIGAAFNTVTQSVVNDILMPPIGKLIGNVDFKNLYISLSDNIDQQNMAVAATQPSGSAGGALAALSSSARLPLEEAKKLGAVIAYGNFITTLINFLIVALSVFMVVKVMNMAKKRFEKQEAAAPPPPPSTQEVLLTEIRDILKTR
ncbi:MAG TPA: large conductance mechanosensitive channel protein MscL [Tepidisphaeraceae bacterium]|jgi:large conductance mechanosensitive channel|nr:large conductance mechanosensitive channel protein MscL [Tepidisphaeraceae bacterium]